MVQRRAEMLIVGGSAADEAVVGGATSGGSVAGCAMGMEVALKGGTG